MCGLAGIFNLSDRAPPQRETLRAMIEALHHRGPDGYGFFSDSHCGLAHARLSIIDIAGGNQPIHNEESNVWVVFNGEIFNFIELRQDLERAGHRFTTHSDTEVIVHAYEQYGLNFVDHLNGQFAVALWDQAKRRLVLARDRTGIRPLFYTEANGSLIFGSEVKSLFAVSGITRGMNLSAVGDVLTYWSALEPDTVFENIHSLPAGHMMIVEKGRREIKKYWDWTFPTTQPTRDRSVVSYVEELRELLIDSVRLQLRADVPVGAYLSGGLDSSVIAALVKVYNNERLRTFSIAFEDAEFDESAFQDEMTRKLGTQHTRVVCKTRDIAAAFPRVIWHTETPIVRTAPTPLMLLSEAVRQHGYKVVLTGEGADEVFGGYDLFKEAKIRRFWSRFPQSKMRPRLLDRLYPYLKNSPAATRAMTDRFYAQGMDAVSDPCFAHLPRWSTTHRSWQFLSKEARAELGEQDYVSRARTRLPSEVADFLPIGRDQYVEAHTLLSGYLLNSQSDRVAMANSIEGRFPFLDHRVIEFASRLPPSLKINGLNEKYLLKRAMQDLLPPSIAKRTKQPYRAPDSQSFFSDGKSCDYVDDLLSEDRLRSAGYFDPLAVGKLVAKCRAGRAIGFSDNMAFVGILSTMLVDEMFIRRRQASTLAVESWPLADRSASEPTLTSRANG
ncbi:MAG TPA: asparagine synthase (glutamine-hydrolyzing) [Steroidobacteraceae bacterium]|nr:asparagine synthase (glutamine-hydrolyzing) [Steroidobacteraceae bacterium]